MVGTELFGKSWFRASMACCSAVALMAVVAGCPVPDPTPDTPCTVDDACPDDGNACTTDPTCEVVDDAAVCTYPAVACDEGSVCDPADGSCVDDLCVDDDGVATDCDDGDPCTTESVCDPVTGDCSTADPVVCDEGFSCNADTGGCEADDPCADFDADACDDLNPCTDDSCDPESGACVNADVDCDDGSACTDDSCDPETGECMNPDSDCDDDDACTDDSCDPDIGCANVPVSCEEGETCVDGACVADLCADEDCDDDNECTADSCAVVDDAAVCTNEDTSDCAAGEACDPATGLCGEDLCVDVTCEDDGDACTIESCDTTTGECSSAAVVCDEGETCVGGVCGAVCTEDADCADDGTFCNGTESCDTEAGACVSSGDPCVGDETCNEALNACDPAPFETVLFTLENDALVGTGGDDIFDGSLEFNPPTGTNVPTVQTGDSANGGDGDDTLNATFNFNAAATVAPTLTSIETINITDFGTTAATTLSGTNITGATDFNFSNSTNTNAFVVTNLPGLPGLANLGISQQAIGVTLGFQSAASSGSTDAATMTFNGMTAGTVTYTTGNTNGLETLNIVSNTNASTVADIVMNGTTLTTINVSGDADFTLTASLDANVTTLNASTATGDTNFFQNNAGAFTYTGGGGDDTLVLGATYGTTDTVAGGAGTDILSGTTAVIGGTTSPQSGVTEFETLRVSNAHTTAIDVTDFGSIGEVVLDVGSNGGSVTETSTGFSLSLGVRAGTAAGAGTLTTTVSGSGTSDSVTCTLNDAEQAGLVTFTGAETVNLVSNLDLDGSAANTGVAGQNTFATLTLTDTAAQEKLVVTGTEQMNITGAVVADAIDASGMTEPFIMGAAMTTAGVTVDGGTGADTLFASSGNDIVNGGEGNDIINPLAGNDIVSGGAGVDTFRQSAAAADGADRQTISDFDDTITTGDVYNFNSGVATLTGTDNFGTSATIQTHSTPGNLTVNAAAEIVVVTSNQTANLLTSGAANVLNGTDVITAVGGTITGAIVGQNDILIAIADANGNVGIYHASSGDNAIINTEISLIAVLQGSNVAISGLIFNNFSNGA